MMASFHTPKGVDTNNYISTKAFVSFLSYPDERYIHSVLTDCMLYLCIPVFLFLHYVMPAPFGKHYTSTSKSNNSHAVGGKAAALAISPKVAWFLFECPNLLWSVTNLYRAPTAILPPRDGIPTINLLLLSLFVLHYIHRSIIYPIRLSCYSRPVPLSVFFSAMLYTTWNGYIQTQDLCSYQAYTDHYLKQPTLYVGLMIFLCGFGMNYRADATLRALRIHVKKTDVDSTTTNECNPIQGYYKIPYGGLFTFVSCPNYLGEIIEWFGFTVACGFTKCSLAFFLFTCANLIPRAFAHHRWYLTNFPELYPQLHRKAILPFIL